MDSELRVATATLNKREGERAGIESSLNLLQEEVDTVRRENEEMAKISLRDTRILKDLNRKIASLEAALTFEREEMENVFKKNLTASNVPSRTSTPLKANNSNNNNNYADRTSHR